ncbi:DeoR family transcriptional regulator [Dactylosporangium cerinum]
MKVQRIQAIENLIHEKGSVSLDDLCEQFNVSKNTVRRDIAKLLQKTPSKGLRWCRFCL